MSSLPYLLLVVNVSKVNATITIIVNSILIFITFRDVRNITPAYKFMIFLQAQLGILFSSIDILMHPFIHSYNSGFAFFSLEKVFGASKMLKTALMISYSVTYAVIICLVAIQFIYRYCVVIGSSHVKLFSGWKVIVWIFYVMLFGSIWGVFCSLNIPDDYVNEYYRNEMKEQYGANIEDTAGLFMVAYKTTKKGASLRYESVAMTAGVSSVLLVQYTIMIYSGIKIHKKIDSLLKLKSNKAMKVHRQFLKTLTLQITAPSIFYHLPAVLITFLPFFDLEISFPSGIMIVCFSVYPALDSIILMWIVNEYNEAIKRNLNKLFIALAELTKASATLRDATTSNVR